MRPLAFLTLFLAALAVASPVDEQYELNEPVLPQDEDRCKQGYDECIAVRNSPICRPHTPNLNQLTHLL